MNIIDATQKSVETIRHYLGDDFNVLYTADAKRLDEVDYEGDRHRLMQNIRDAEDSIRSGVELSVPAVVELDILAQLLSKWSSRPEWPDVIKQLKDPNDYAHMFCQLTTASYLESFGNIEFCKQPQTGRSPDLKLVTGNDILLVENKAPRELRRPDLLLNDLSAKNLLFKIKKRAKGQLQNERSGMLAIGGYYISNENIEKLLDAARAYFSERGADHPHLLGFAFVFPVMLFENIHADGTGKLSTSESTSIKILVRTKVELNPRYIGETTLFQPKTTSELDGALELGPHDVWP